MRKGGTGGAIASKSGSDFELKTQDSLIKNIIKKGYRVTDYKFQNASSGTYRYINLESKHNELNIFFQSNIYKYFFEPKNIFVKDFFSHRLQPDTAIYSKKAETLTVVEKKQQNVSGSVAEKLQTCDYKYMFYSKLCNPLHIKVELAWELGSYFKNNETTLRSVFEYMRERNNKIFFYEIDVNKLTL
jgi:hypothetical protein